MNEGQLLLLWPGEVRRKREGDFGQIGPALGDQLIYEETFVFGALRESLLILACHWCAVLPRGTNIKY